MAVDNSTILDKIWLEGTNDYQQRVPNSTQGSVAQSMDAIFSPMNRNLFNQFMDAYINLIGRQVVHSKKWDNPLATFKGSMMSFGHTIQESAPKWIRAHGYDDEDMGLLKMYRPEVEVWYHSLNREDMYPITINRQELARAFHDEYGLNALADALLTTPVNSDNYDEFNLMLNLIAVYQSKFGFAAEVINDPSGSEADGRAFLIKLRELAGLLAYPSERYNSVNVPVFARPEELVLITTPKVLASIDVNNLAPIFNIDKANIQYRTILVPEMPIPDAYALLTTEDFFVAHDVVYETGSFYMPNTLNTNYFLHHWGIYSVSPFVPAILFASEAYANSVPTVQMSATGLTLESASDTVQRGGSVVLTPTLTGTLDPENPNVEVKPDAVTWSISLENALVSGSVENEDAVYSTSKLNARTYVDRLGVLHVQKSGLVDGDKITVTGATTYINPSTGTGERAEFTGDVTVTVDGLATGERDMERQLADNEAKESYRK